MSLQNTFALESKYNDKYLCYIDNEDPQLHGFLKFSEDKFSTPHSKFHKEPASTADEFINIRSVYSNKYWVSRYENDEHWIVAEANEPNEDQSSSSCTLFQAIPVDDGSAIRLLHVHLNKYVRLSKDSSQFPLCIFAGSVDPDPDRIDVFVVKNIIPPKQSGPSRLAFKGDNEKYLKVEVIDGKPHLKFSAKDTDEAEVWFKCPNIAKKNDTSGHIQSNFNNEFWRCDHNWVNAEAENATADPKTLFHFHWEDCSNNIVTLRVGNIYCQRFVDHEGKSSKMDCLIANTFENTPQAKLHVEVRKR